MEHTVPALVGICICWISVQNSEHEHTQTHADALVLNAYTSVGRKTSQKQLRGPKVLSPLWHFPKAPEVEVKVSKRTFAGRAEQFGLARRDTSYPAAFPLAHIEVQVGEGLLCDSTSYARNLIKSNLMLWNLHNFYPVSSHAWLGLSGNHRLLGKNIIELVAKRLLAVAWWNWQQRRGWTKTLLTVTLFAYSLLQLAAFWIKNMLLCLQTPFEHVGLDCIQLFKFQVTAWWLVSNCLQTNWQLQCKLQVNMANC